jgi:hypothetical protein
MNTKLIMTISALFLGVLGLSLSFFPTEINELLNTTPNTTSTMFLQLLSAVYLGFALMNWMAKGTLIGGIYNRPIAIGNFMHFMVGTLALIKIISHIDMYKSIIIGLTIVYALLAICFVYIFRTNPAK